MPPAPPRPIADASSGGAVGGAGAADGQAGMAASPGGPAAATSAAVPVAGALVAVGGHSLELAEGFYVVWPRSRELNGPARRVRDWLVEEGRLSREAFSDI